MLESSAPVGSMPRDSPSHPSIASTGPAFAAPEASEVLKRRLALCHCPDEIKTKTPNTAIIAPAISVKTGHTVGVIVATSATIDASPVINVASVTLDATAVIGVANATGEHRVAGHVGQHEEHRRDDHHASDRQSVQTVGEVHRVRTADDRQHRSGSHRGQCEGCEDGKCVGARHFERVFDHIVKLDEIPGLGRCDQR